LEAPIDVTLTENDLEDLEQYARAHDPEAPTVSRKYIALVLVGLLVLWLARSGLLGTDIQGLPRLLWTVFAVAVILGYLKSRSDARQSPYVPVIDFSISIERSGLKLSSDDSNTTLLWEDIEEIVDAERYILIYQEHDQLVVIPKRAFPSVEASLQFLDSARTFYLRHRYHGGAT